MALTTEQEAFLAAFADRGIAQAQAEAADLAGRVALRAKVDEREALAATLELQAKEALDVIDAEIEALKNPKKP